VPLAGLKNLKKLTLFGNPFEEKKYYRNFVIHHLPSVMMLDFAIITRLDREKAKAWASSYRAKQARNAERARSASPDR
jgi:hypothetical protein